MLESLSRAAATVCSGLSGYVPASLSSDASSSADRSEFELLGELPGKDVVAALPIVADRVKLPAAPAFSPQSFMDSHTANMHDRPLDFARAPDPEVDRPPSVKILASPAERIKLLACLRPFEASEACSPAEQGATSPNGFSLLGIKRHTQADRRRADFTSSQIQKGQLSDHHGNQTFPPPALHKGGLEGLRKGGRAKRPRRGSGFTPLQK